MAVISSEDDGANGWSTTLRNKRHCTLCFWQLELPQSNLVQRQMAEVTPTGVYVRNRSVPRANHVLTGTLLGASCIYSSVGIYSVRSIKEASYGLSHGTSRCRYPVFFRYVGINRVKNNLAWVFVRTK